jgi:diacylglycerol kinase (ATP)
MARVLLITNPLAGRTDPEVVPTVSAVLKREGWDVEVVEIARPGHAAELAAAGANDGADVVAVYGGDGTTMQAVRGLRGTGVPLGLIPGGTGNLLAGNLRVPRNPKRAARIIARGRPRAIDLGCVERDDGTHYFAVACGAGFDAELMATTTTEAKRRWKMAAYVARAWMTISRVRSVPCRVTVDDVVHEGEAASVLVANCAEFIPPLVKFRRGVAIDDGVLDVVMLNAHGFFQSLGVLFEWVTGSRSRRIRHARGRRITVEMDPCQPVQFDGESGGRTPFTAELLPGALKVLARR